MPLWTAHHATGRLRGCTDRASHEKCSKLHPSSRARFCDSSPTTDPAAVSGQPQSKRQHQWDHRLRLSWQSWHWHPSSRARTQPPKRTPASLFCAARFFPAPGFDDAFDLQLSCRGWCHVKDMFLAEPVHAALRHDQRANKSVQEEIVQAVCRMQLFAMISAPTRVDLGASPSNDVERPRGPLQVGQRLELAFSMRKNCSRPPCICLLSSGCLTLP